MRTALHPRCTPERWRGTLCRDVPAPKTSSSSPRRTVATLAPIAGQGERIIWDAERRGLGIRIRASGARTWVIRPPRKGGASKLHALGSVEAMSLASARLTAEEKLAEAAGGIDPTKAKAEARKQAALTFGSLIERYIADKEGAGRRPSTIGNLKNHLNAHWLPLHDRPLNGITRADISKRHRELVTAHGPHAADRARSILSTFYVWAAMEGMADGNPVENTRTATVPTRRDRTLNDVELAAIWQACRDDDFGRIVRLLVLTGQRRNEVAGLARSELQLASSAWILPAARSKNHRPHEIPLAPLTLEILAPAIEREGRELLFGDGEGAFSGFSKAKAALGKRLAGAAGEWNIHDLRRTCATGMANLGVQPHIVEAVLNHISGSKAGVAGIYNRAVYRDEKRVALNLWAEHVAALVNANAKSEA